MSNKLIFLIHACRTEYLLHFLGLERISYGRGRSKPLSFVVLMQPCLHIMLVLYSDLVNMCNDYHNHS
jgi:hypothetical protein